MLKKWCEFLSCNIEKLGRIDFQGILFKVLQCLDGSGGCDEFLCDLSVDTPENRKALIVLQKIARKDIDLFSVRDRDADPECVGGLSLPSEVWIIKGKFVRIFVSGLSAHTNHDQNTSILQFSRFEINADSVLLAAYTSNIKLNRFFKCTECGKYITCTAGKFIYKCKRCFGRTRQQEHRANKKAVKP